MPTTGRASAYDVRFSSWESRDNTQLRFNVRSFDGPKMQEEFRGSAKLPWPRRLRARRTTACPEGEDVALPAGTIFPTEHVADLIAAARAGEHVLNRQVFDGSGEDALTKATAVIGTAKTGDADRRRRGAALAGQHRLFRRRRATTRCRSSRSRSTFPPGGVLSNVRLDYGDFTLKADLEKLETVRRSRTARSRYARTEPAGRDPGGIGSIHGRRVSAGF